MARSTSAAKQEGEAAAGEEDRGECFVIMPISDPDEYAPGHFARVYEDIFKPAIRRAGYEPKRADEVLETNLIQLDLLRRLLEAPMAICDLSSRNPNVLFELGLRQAFDKPVAIVQEEGTPRIFDIAPLRFTEYRKERIYHQVIQDQEAIANAINATRIAAGDARSVNSLVRLLGLTQPATISETTAAERDPALQLIYAELASLRKDFRAASAQQSESVATKTRRLTSPDVRIAYFPFERDDVLFTRFLAYLELLLGTPMTVLDNADHTPGETRIQFDPPVPSVRMRAAVERATAEAGLPAFAWRTNS